MRGRQSGDGGALQGAMAAGMATMTEGDNKVEDTSWRVREGAVDRFKVRTVGGCARPYVHEIRNLIAHDSMRGHLRVSQFFLTSSCVRSLAN